MVDVNRARQRHGEEGSSLLEVLIAMTILTVALVSLAQVFVLGVTHAAMSQNHLVAREKAREAVESVHTARDTRTITWAQIRNAAEGGVFADGAQPLRQAGADGLINTADDPDQLEVIGPGQDGVLGTDDDQRGLGFQREILIEDVAGSPALRQLTIIISYPASGLTPPPFRLVTFVSSFS
jgi:type II secretory pathway pseudopilin PulG